MPRADEYSPLFVALCQRALELASEALRQAFGLPDPRDRPKLTLIRGGMAASAVSGSESANQANRPSTVRG